MASVEWAYLCDFADMHPNGKKDLIGILSHIEWHKPGLGYPQIYAAAYIQLEAGEDFSVRSTISEQEGAIISQSPFTVTAQTDWADGKFVALPHFMVEFAKLGQHVVRILADDSTLHELPLDILRPSKVC